MTKHTQYKQETIDRLNETIKQHENIFPIEPGMIQTHSETSRIVMLDRYAQRDITKESLGVGDVVVVTVKPDPKWPKKGVGFVERIDGKNVKVFLEEEYRESPEKDTIICKIDDIDKPLELYYEQIAKRNARGLASVEVTDEKTAESAMRFETELVKTNLVPAGRVLYGAGSGTEVTYFNCFVMPFVNDSREGISDHRKQTMGIMSRGGGVGTNGSTLRPRNALARGVNGSSSGAVTWLNDLSQLTNLVIQGGSRFYK